ncbi:MAG: S9 family peptidase [Rhodospirillaceae bacterium]|nr:S9 family peptidase [Rhodospirillaceae bacterium]
MVRKLHSDVLQRIFLRSYKNKNTASPPVADRRNEYTKRFGETIPDPYGWLRDPNWQRVVKEPDTLNTAIKDHLEAENQWTNHALEPVEKMRAKLVDELRARLKEDDDTVPLKDNEWSYFKRFLPGEQYPIFCRLSSSDGSEQILIDCNKEAKQERFFSVKGTAHSLDHKYFAAAVDRNGSEYCKLEIREAHSGRIIDNSVISLQGDIVFSADGCFIFYTWLNDNHRPSRIYRHEIGKNVENDKLVYEECDSEFFLSIDITESRNFIIISAHDHSDTSEVRIIPADQPELSPQLIWKRQQGVTCVFSDSGNSFFILTNEGDGIDFRICKTPINKPSIENWKTFVPHENGRLIQKMLVFKKFIVWLERSNALPRICIKEILTGNQHYVDFEEEAYEVTLSRGYEFNSNILRFYYSSPTTPQQVFDFDMRNQKRKLLKEHEVPNGYDQKNYICKRLYAKSTDSVLIPVTVLHHKNTPIDSSSPLLLYGYGSYGYSMPATFSANLISLLDRGFVYAIAHVRGGSECGKEWHVNGKLYNKMNTFGDFISAAEMLIKKNYSAKGKIIAQGRSAGGMLMGAIANMKPELFNGIIAEVPFVDVMNTMSDANLPLTPPEWLEWGNPIKDENAFKYMLAYCPYSNVSDIAYPNILATGGLTDPRVTYWEPAKWIAKLRHHNISDSLILLRTNMEAGHGGASGRFDKLSEVALSWAFSLMISGKIDRDKILEGN